MTQVWLIDPDAAFVAAAQLSLNRVGLSSAAVPSAAAARALLTGPAPLVLWVRDALPDATGEALLAQVRTHAALREVPALFVHAAAPDPSVAARLAQAGVVRHLVLPVPLLRLRRALAQLPAIAQASRAAPAHSAELDLVTTMDLFDEFLGIASRHVQAMRDAVTQLDGPARAEALDTLHKQGHRLKGSGAAYGLPEVTRLGGEVERLAHLPEAATGALHAAVEALARRLVEVAEEATLPATP